MKKTILAIDDSKAIRYLLQTVLGEYYQVVTAPDGCSAMYWLSKRNTPDLIICDPKLSDMQDWELIEELGSSILYRNIPIVVISSFDKENTEKKSVQYGAAAHFIKPFNPLSLLESVNELLGKKKTWGIYSTSLS